MFGKQIAKNLNHVTKLGHDDPTGKKTNADRTAISLDRFDRECVIGTTMPGIPPS
jgi:hypothetical protein